MSIWSPDDQEEVIILSTQKTAPRWLRILLKILAVILALALAAGGVIAWRYYAVHQRLRKDLTVVIREEEHIRALGGVNAVNDMIDPRAPDSWRFRYISSVRARKGRTEPEIKVEKVDYDGFNARVSLLLDGVRQHRRYRLYTGKDWRRSPFVAKGWGYKQTIENAGGFDLVYWDEDETFGKSLAEDLPALVEMMNEMGLTPASGKKIIIIPKELGDLLHPAQRTKGLVLNSPHVDLIDVPPGDLTPQQLLRAVLSKRIVTDARHQSPIASKLPGANRVQDAIDEALAWQWAAGGIPDGALADWSQKLKGHWVSPVTGLPPDLITELPPDAPDAAARLMMAWLLREKGHDALLALSAALPKATSWDEVYLQVAGLTAAQIEELARQLAQQPDGPLPEETGGAAAAAPESVILLTTSSDAQGRLLGRTPAGRTVLLEPEPNATFTLADGSGLDYECVAPGSEVQVQGDWLDAGLRLGFSAMTLKQATLPLSLQAPPLDPEADALVWRYVDDSPPVLALMQLYPGGVLQLLPRANDPTRRVVSLALSRPNQSPVLAWRSSVDCNRDWLLAYDPLKGVIGSWLAPSNAPVDVNADAVIPDKNITLLVTFGIDKNATSFLTGASHILHPLTDAEKTSLLRKIAFPGIPVIERETNTIQIDDPVTKTYSLLYQPGAGEELMEVIPAFGGPNDAVFVAVRSRNAPLGPVRVLKLSLEKPGEASLAFEASPRGRITSMALCPDGGYLYGLTIPSSTKTQGVLRLHKPSGEDIALSSPADELLTPVYCAKMIR